MALNENKQPVPLSITPALLPRQQHRRSLFQEPCGDKSKRHKHPASTLVLGPLAQDEEKKPSAVFGGQCAASKANIMTKPSVENIPLKDNIRKQVDATTPVLYHQHSVNDLVKSLFSEIEESESLLAQLSPSEKKLELQARLSKIRDNNMIIKHMPHAVPPVNSSLPRTQQSVPSSVSTAVPNTVTTGLSTPVSDNPIASTGVMATGASLVNQQAVTTHQASQELQPASAATGSSVIPVSGNPVPSTSSQVTSTTSGSVGGSTGNAQIIKGWNNRIATPLYHKQIGTDIVIGLKDLSTTIMDKCNHDTALHLASSSANFLVRLMSAVFKDEELVGKRLYSCRSPLFWQEEVQALMNDNRFLPILYQVDRQFPGFIHLLFKVGEKGKMIRAAVNAKCKHSEAKVRQLANSLAAQYNM